MAKIDLSIIIVSFNTKYLLKNCLTSIYRSLSKTKIGYEVIVVDNASIDGSPQMVKQDFKKVRLIQNSENAGFGKANNQATKEASGEVILFLNSDIMVRDQAIDKLLSYYQKLDCRSIVGGKLFNTDETPQDSCGPAYSLANIFIALFLKGDHFHITRYSPDIVKEVDWIMGACMMMRREAFVEVGGFDEGIFMYMEEIDWQYRAQKNGYHIYFYPDAHFIHVGAGSSQGRANPILNVFRGFKFYYKKHYSLGANGILRVLLVLKSIIAIGLFTLLNKKYDRKIYIDALKLSLT